MTPEEEQYYNECGLCPNCGTTVHQSQLGKGNNVATVCVHCVDQEKNAIEAWNENVEETLK